MRRWLPVLALVAACGGEPAPPVDSDVSSDSVLTQHNDARRSGAYLYEKKLDTTNVRGEQFGYRCSRRVDGQIYAQPLYVKGVGGRNLLIVATMAGSVYAFDADDESPDPDGAQVWHAALRPANPRPPAPDPQEEFLAGTPTIGVMSTPVADPSQGALFAVSATGPVDAREFWLYKLALADGAVLDETRVAGAVTAGGVTTTFDGALQIQRTGLLLSRDEVYFAFAGYGDAGDYHGWVMGYPARGKLGAADRVFCDTPHSADFMHHGGGIWQSGNGLAADDDGNLYLLTGNGPLGEPADHPRAFEDSFVRLTPDGAGFAARAWTPPDFFVLERDDQDLGSGGALLLPGGRVVGGGKTGVLYLLDRALPSPGGPPIQCFQAAVRQYPSTFGADFQPRVDGETGCPITYDTASIDAPNIHGTPVAWTDGAGVTRVYVWAEKDSLRAYPYAVDRGFDLAHALATDVKANMGMPGGALSISADGSRGGSGVLWASIPEPEARRCHGDALCDASHSLVPGRLFAFDAATLAELWSTSVPLYAKFNPPTVAGGRAYLATFAGDLRVYGLRPLPAQELVGSGAAAGSAPAAAVDGARVDVYVRGAHDDRLAHRFFDGAAWQASDLAPDPGPPLVGSPAAAAGGVFARDLAGGLVFRLGGGPWGEGGGLLGGDPVAVTDGDGAIHVFAVRADGRLAHARVAGAWAGWDAAPELLAQALAPGSRPAAAVEADGTLDVLARGGDGNLLLLAADPDGTWRGWESAGGSLASDPAAASPEAGRLDVLGLAADDTLVHALRANGGWRWEAAPFAGVVLAHGEAPSVASLGPDRLDVFARGARGGLRHVALLDGAWLSWEWLGDGVALATATVATPRGLAVVSADGDGATLAVVHPGAVLPPGH